MGFRTAHFERLQSLTARLAHKREGDGKNEIGLAPNGCNKMHDADFIRNKRRCWIRRRGIWEKIQRKRLSSMNPHAACV
jgi:hypothetical protein